MKNKLSLLLLAAATVATAAHAEEGPKDYTLEGYFDLYYQFDLGRPGSGNNINGRRFDSFHNSYRLAAAAAEGYRLPTHENRWGFKVSLQAGDRPDAMADTEPGGRDAYRIFEQAFLSYMAGGAQPITFSIGKFASPIGYEGADSRIQANYSRGFNFSMNQPDYHAGIRASMALNSSMTADAYVVKGWNEVEDSNDSLSFIGSLAIQNGSRMNLRLTGYTGKEGSTGLLHDSFGGFGLPVAGEFRVNLGDAVLTYNLSSDTDLILDATYASVNGLGHFNGQALYIRKKLSDKTDGCLRFDRSEDTNGLRSGTPIQLHSVTATYDYNINSRVLLRFELRHDMASRAAFNADNGPKRSRTTLTFAQVIKF